MPEAAPAQGMALLEVETHLDAEIFLIGNDRQLVARAVGKLRIEQPKGLYRIKVTRASAAVERLVDLDNDLAIKIDVPGLDTIVPFARTAPANLLPRIEQLAVCAAQASSSPPNLLLIGRMPAAAQPSNDESGAAQASPFSISTLICLLPDLAKAMAVARSFPLEIQALLPTIPKLRFGR